MSDFVRLHAVIHGRVQGVYYRAFTSRTAKSLSLKGYVRNTSSGDVEVEAEGERDKIEIMLNQLRIGPPEALVENIDTQWSDYSGKYMGFDVRY